MIVDFDLLVRETADAFGIDPHEVLGLSRKKTEALARHVVMALWADDHAYQDTVDRCRRRCHNTAMFASAKVFAMAQIDVSFARMVAGISARCQCGAKETSGTLPENEEKEENRKFFVDLG